MKSMKLFTQITCILTLIISQNLFAQLTMDRIDSSNRASNENEKQDPIHLIAAAVYVAQPDPGEVCPVDPDGVEELPGTAGA